jgi:prevent-host-death family protein
MPVRRAKRKSKPPRRPPSSLWPAEKARANFARVLEAAERGRPQRISRHGREIAVVISPEEYRRLAGPKESLVEFFRKSPLAEIVADTGIEFPRDKTPIGPPIDLS